MYLYRDDAERLTAEMREGLSSAVRRITEQLLKFYDDSDWAMIIKLHAAVEATVTQAIVAHIDQESLRYVLERLPLSDNQTGKGRIALDLGIVTKSQFTFLRKFSELRNLLVHKVENIDFNAADYFSSMTIDQLKSWRVAIAWQADGKKQESLAEMLDRNPKVAIFVSVFTMLTLLVVSEQEKLVRHKVDFMSERTMRELMGGDLEGNGGQSPA